MTVSASTAKSVVSEDVSDGLDALDNTTDAIGKGFANGTAVEANVCTAPAATSGLNDVLKVSFASGGLHHLV